ncbi:MAG: methyltransferase domain-containing protein [Deltaproteobacteria bacterium]|nr:methyltransferase domain-containing protein [Deltaproteobacteria bacterium]
MAHRICPAWLGYFLLNPLRRILENPESMLSGLVREGMTVLEPGCGMGFFTLPIARMVGAEGRVVAVDIQSKMLSALGRRAERAGLSERIDLRLAGPDGLGLEEIPGTVDLAVALHVVHEVPDQASFFAEIVRALKPEGKLLVIEPRGHVSPEQMEETIFKATAAGFEIEDALNSLFGRSALLVKAISRNSYG